MLLCSAFRLYLSTQRTLYNMPHSSIHPSTFFSMFKFFLSNIYKHSAWGWFLAQELLAWRLEGDRTNNLLISRQVILLPYSHIIIIIVVYVCMNICVSVPYVLLNSWENLHKHRRKYRDWYSEKHYKCLLFYLLFLGQLYRVVVFWFVFNSLSISILELLLGCFQWLVSRPQIV